MKALKIQALLVTLSLSYATTTHAMTGQAHSQGGENCAKQGLTAGVCNPALASAFNSLNGFESLAGTAANCKELGQSKNQIAQTPKLTRVAR